MHKAMQNVGIKMVWAGGPNHLKPSQFLHFALHYALCRGHPRSSAT